MKPFSKTLNYASCNEDWRSEWKALQIRSNDTVLCIVGSGDRPLDLLPQDPKKVITVDNNPIQHYLLQLKMAAMAALPYDEYAAFLGLNNSDSRLDYWPQIQPNLTDECAKFWLENQQMLERGVLYQGRWEQHFAKMASILALIRGEAIHRLFKFQDIVEQRRFVISEWDRWWWRLTLSFFFSQTFSRVFFGDPGFYQYVPKEKKIGDYIFRRLQTYLSDHLARESFMVRLGLTGRISEDDLPPYLDPAAVPVITNRINRLEIHEGDVIDVLEKVEAGSISRFSLSDTPSFLDQAGFECMLDGMVRAAAPQARFCLRMFLSDQAIPTRFDGVLVREPALEKRLCEEDRSIAYRFIVGTVNKDGR